jgi:FlaA1/EpsC-like NDP-sugar epimerase
LLISELLLVTSAFVFATYLILEVDPTVFLLYDGGLSRIALVVLSILVGLHFHDLYTHIHVQSKIVLVQQLCLVMGVAFLTQGLIAYVNSNLRVPIRVMVVGSAIAVIAVLFWRIVFSAFALQVVGRDRLLLVGGSPLLEDIGRYIAEHPETGLEIAGYVDDRHQPSAPLRAAKRSAPWARSTRSSAPPSPTALSLACSNDATVCPWPICSICASPET